MVEAFILVQTEVGKAKPVATLVAAVAGITSAEAVVGPYDVIVRAAAESASTLAAIVREVQQIAGITRTLTCEVAAATVRNGAEQAGR
ncbi:Lrp/AsnC ligand binding domain-containing protein [Antrihabitans sp. NCIMB 15449]|uniref:Lrp/AsnC ligand binding domain-containing protein n=1 Tax=Antrihabitans spumae TaxID=3373370 RepID=A0ABW7JRD4_9NOCA